MQTGILQFSFVQCRKRTKIKALSHLQNVHKNNCVLSNAVIKQVKEVTLIPFNNIHLKPDKCGLVWTLFRANIYDTNAPL